MKDIMSTPPIAAKPTARVAGMKKLLIKILIRIRCCVPDVEAQGA